MPRGSTRRNARRYVMRPGPDRAGRERILLYGVVWFSGVLAAGWLGRVSGGGDFCESRRAAVWLLGWSGLGRWRSVCGRRDDGSIVAVVTDLADSVRLRSPRADSHNTTGAR